MINHNIEVSVIFPGLSPGCALDAPVMDIVS